MRLLWTSTRPSWRAALRIAAAGSVSAAAIALAAVGGPAPAGAAPAVPSACSGVVTITHLAFKPPVVYPGQTSAVHLVALNCTSKTQTTTVTWLGQFERAGGGIPPGCPAIDPFSQGAIFAPGGTFRAKVSYLVPANCTATALAVTARISKGDRVLAQKTATLTITRPPA